VFATSNNVALLTHARSAARRTHLLWAMRMWTITSTIGTARLAASAAVDVVTTVRAESGLSWSLTRASAAGNRQEKEQGRNERCKTT
jgi:hypothetical protein